MRNIKVVLLSLVLLPLVFPSYNGGDSDQIKGLVEEFMDAIYSSCTFGLYNKDKEEKEKPVEVRCYARGQITVVRSSTDERGRVRQQWIDSSSQTGRYYITYEFYILDSSGKHHWDDRRAESEKPADVLTVQSLRPGENIIIEASCWVGKSGSGGTGMFTWQTTKQLTYNQARHLALVNTRSDRLFYIWVPYFVFQINPDLLQRHQQP